MKKRHFLLGLLCMALVGCHISQTEEDISEDFLICGDNFPPTIAAYGALDSVAFDIPESEYFPQYKDWDTIIFCVFRNFKWNAENPDSIILLQYVPYELGEDWITRTGEFRCKKGEKRKIFDYYPGELHDAADSVADYITGPFYMEITKQLVPSMVESSLKKVHHVIVPDGSNKHFNAFKDSVVGFLCLCVCILKDEIDALVGF